MTVSIKNMLRVALVVLCASFVGCASSPWDGSEDVTYVALGASDAVGIGAIPLRRGYVFRIEDGLEKRRLKVNLVNLGIAGAQIDDIERISQLAPLARPQLVTIWTGANDLINGADPAAFEEELEDMLERLRDDTDAFIVIADLPNLTLIPRFLENPSRVVTPERVQAFNAAIERQAERFDIPVARLSEMDMLEELTSDIDGFHPNNRGHQMIADRFLMLILPKFVD